MKLQKRKIGNWTWHLTDNDQDLAWFENRDVLMSRNTVKSNAVRTVFTVNNRYYVKYDSPEKITKQLRSLFLPKVKLEFDIAMKLEESGIPVVKYLGWGKKGSLGFLLTKSYPHSTCVRDYWFQNYVYGTRKDKTAFLKKLTNLIFLLIENGFYHPDFHLGNILIDTATCEMALVDVYGVKKLKVLSEGKIYKMVQIVAALRDGLTDSECRYLIEQIGYSAESSSTAWNLILHDEALRANKLWNKRRRQVLDNHEKYSTVVNDGEDTLVLKHDQTRNPIFDPEKLNGIEQNSEIIGVMYDRSAATKVWLASFLLQFHSISHVRPLVWQQSAKGSDTLYFELRNKEQGDEALFNEFLSRCSCAGLEIKRSDICICDGKPYISDITVVAETL